MVNDQRLFCPVQATLDVISGKWKTELIWHLLTGIKRPSELKKLIPNISERMMIQQLRELEEQGVVERIPYPEIPPKVEYKLTTHGETLRDLLVTMEDWGLHHYKTIQGDKPFEHQLSDLN